MSVVASANYALRDSGPGSHALELTGSPHHDSLTNDHQFTQEGFTSRFSKSVVGDTPQRVR